MLSGKGARGGITGPTGWSRPVGLTGLRCAAGAMGAVGTAGELEDHRAVDQAVEERRRQRWITQVVGPRAEVDVRRQRGRAPARAGVEQTVVEGAGLGLGFTLQPVEPEFVDQQEIKSRILGEHPAAGPVGQRRGELLEQLGAGRVPHAVSLHARGMAHGLEDSAFAQARLPCLSDLYATAESVWRSISTHSGEGTSAPEGP